MGHGSSINQSSQTGQFINFRQLAMYCHFGRATHAGNIRHPKLTFTASGAAGALTPTHISHHKAMVQTVIARNPKPFANAHVLTPHISVKNKVLRVDHRGFWDAGSRAHALARPSNNSRSRMF